MSPKLSKKIKKLMLLTASVAILSGVVAPYPASICEAASDTEISVCADILEWIYKVEDGKVYRRLYNASTGEWIGDWIYVGLYGQDN